MAKKEDLSSSDGVKSPAMKGIDPKPVSNTNVVSDMEKVVTTTESSATKEAKKVTITEAANEAAGDMPDLTTTKSDGQLDAVERDDELENGNTPMEMGVGKKKKKKSKPKSKRGLNAPTGFEEYYVDAPLTPAEHEIERSIYDPSYPFTQRIEQAIQRFVAKRKFDAEGTTLFDRYLVHGGVKGGPKMFGGLDAEALKTKSAAEIAELAATHYVDPDKVDAFDSTHVVDFEGCLASFLSGRFAGQWELTSEDKVKYLIGIIRNFFNYLLYHEVCPEYKDQINAARTLCDNAVTEIWNYTTLTPLLPGDFNMACSEIFGGSYQGMYSTDRAWMEDLETECNTGISPERARNVFKIGLAANASDEMFPKYHQQLNERACRVVNVEDVGFEVTEIILANENVLNLYGQEKYADLKAIGKMKAKTWLSPHASEEDLTEEEETYLKANGPDLKSYEFWVEEEILKKCAVGMKFEATVRETSFGLTYFDAFLGVHCSFYKLIPNELMSDWKEIEKAWLPMKRKSMLAGSAGSEDQEEGLEEGEEKGQGASVKQVEVAADKDVAATATEAEVDDYKVNTNIVAAGYDDDFEEKVDDGTELQQMNEQKEDMTEKGFGVEVHKAGVELTKVNGNTDPVVQETFDVKGTT